MPVRSTEAAITADPGETLSDLLTYAELLKSPRLARLYTFLLRNGPVSIDTVKEELEMPHSTTYKYVRQLEKMGVLTRNKKDTPTTVTVVPIRLRLEADDGEAVATPVLIDAVGRQLEDKDIQVFLERHGVAKLASALHYTIRVMNGELTQRTAASRLGVHSVEGMTVINALQDVVEDAAHYDPYLEPI